MNNSISPYKLDSTNSFFLRYFCVSIALGIKNDKPVYGGGDRADLKMTECLFISQPIIAKRYTTLLHSYQTLSTPMLVIMSLSIKQLVIHSIHIYVLDDNDSFRSIG